MTEFNRDEFLRKRQMVMMMMAEDILNGMNPLTCMMAALSTCTRLLAIGFEDEIADLDSEDESLDEELLLEGLQWFYKKKLQQDASESMERLQRMARKGLEFKKENGRI